jgi:hypothetical protein
MPKAPSAFHLHQHILVPPCEQPPGFGVPKHEGLLALGRIRSSTLPDDRWCGQVGSRGRRAAKLRSFCCRCQRRPAFHFEHGVVQEERHPLVDLLPVEQQAVLRKEVGDRAPIFEAQAHDVAFYDALAFGADIGGGFEADFSRKRSTI